MGPLGWWSLSPVSRPAVSAYSSLLTSVCHHVLYLLREPTNHLVVLQKCMKESRFPKYAPKHDQQWTPWALPTVQLRRWSERAKGKSDSSSWKPVPELGLHVQYSLWKSLRVSCALFHSLSMPCIAWAFPRSCSFPLCQRAEGVRHQTSQPPGCSHCGITPASKKPVARTHLAVQTHSAISHKKVRLFAGSNLDNTRASSPWPISSVSCIQNVCLRPERMTVGAAGRGTAGTGTTGAACSWALPIAVLCHLSKGTGMHCSH